MKEAFRLNDAERGSHAWEKVDAYANDRLATLRRVVENPNKPEAERLSAAWRIYEFKELLRLAEPASEQAPEPGE